MCIRDSFRSLPCLELNHLFLEALLWYAANIHDVVIVMNMECAEQVDKRCRMHLLGAQKLKLDSNPKRYFAFPLVQ